jgi:hypothetical protein
MDRIAVNFSTGQGQVSVNFIETIIKDPGNKNSGKLKLKMVKDPIVIVSNIDGVISKWSAWRAKQAK